MTSISKIKFGDNLKVTDEGAGVIRVDSSGGIGPAGPPGPAGSGASFTFTQGTAATTWNVTHNLGIFPSVTVVDTGGTEIWPNVLYVDANNVTLTFGSATSGKAYLN